MKKFWLTIVLGCLLGTVLTAQPLSNQILQILTRVNTWTATNTYLDLRLQPGVPSDTTNRFYADNAGNVYYGGIILGGASGATTPHNLLSATHADTLAGTVVRGDVIVGNSTPKWARLPIGTSGQILTSNGTDVVWGTSGASLTSLPAANLTGTAAAIVGTAITALNASNLTTGTVPLAQLSGILNAQIGAGAGIVYSKLTLTGSVVNADVASGAAIAYSKLNLTGSVLSGDLAAGTLLFDRWASNSCTNGQVPQYNGSNWACATLGAGTGTVTSVGLAVPGGAFTTAGGPVTGSGTLTLGLQTQSANLVWAGPTTGSAATPTFRSLVNADLPLTGVGAGTYAGGVTVNTAGVVTAGTTSLNLAASVGASILPMANGGTGVSVSADDTVLVGSGTAWVAQTLPNCPTGALAYTQSTNLFSCSTSTVAPHNLLSVSHGDTVAATVVRGDLVTGNSTPAWQRLAIGTAGQLLTTNGLDTSWNNTIAAGTLTVSTPWTWTQTWNAGGVTFEGIVENIASTASAAASKLLDLQVGGVSKFTVDKLGNTVAAGTLAVTGATTLTGALTQTVAPASIAGLTTAGNGTPILLATTGLLSAQAANIAVTNLLSSLPASGFYRVCAFEAVTQAATSSSTMPAVTIKFNNGTAQTNTLIATSSGNVLTTYGQGCLAFQATTATAVTYDAGTTSGAYASSGGTVMQYQLRVTLEALY